MKRKSNSPYTTVETAFILRWWGRKTEERIAKSLRRTLRSVRTKAKSLGLQLVKRKNDHWTQDEMKTLRFFFGQEPVGEIAKRIGRSVISTRVKAYHMGLSAEKKIDVVTASYPINRKGAPKIFWNQNMISYITREFSTTTNKELADHLGISESALHRKARELHLTKDSEWFKMKTREGARMARIVNMTGKNRGQWQYRTEGRGLGFMAKRLNKQNEQ